MYRVHAWHDEAVPSSLDVRRPTFQSVPWKTVFDRLCSRTSFCGASFSERCQNYVNRRHPTFGTSDYVNVCRSSRGVAHDSRSGFCLPSLFAKDAFDISTAKTGGKKYDTSRHVTRYRRPRSDAVRRRRALLVSDQVECGSCAKLWRALVAFMIIFFRDTYLRILYIPCRPLDCTGVTSAL